MARYKQIEGRWNLPVEQPGLHPQKRGVVGHQPFLEDSAGKIPCLGSGFRASGVRSFGLKVQGFVFEGSGFRV